MNEMHERREKEQIAIDNKRISIDRSICRALILNRNESVKVLLRICRQQKHLDGMRICQETIGLIESFSMDREAIEI